MRKGNDKVIIFDIESAKISSELIPDLKPLTEHESSIDFLWSALSDSIKDVTGATRKETQSVLTVPRFLGLRVCEWQDFEKSAYGDNPLELFNKASYQFVNMFGDESLSELRATLTTIITDWLPKNNLLVGAHNFNYDLGYMCCGIYRVAKEIIEKFNSTHSGECILIKSELPETLHKDKTLTLGYYDLPLEYADTDKPKKILKIIDTAKLNPKSLKSIGKNLTNKYGVDFQKLDSYDYDKPVSSLSEMSPTPEELEYNKRDLDICYMALVDLIQSDKEPILLGNKFGLSGFPITNTQISKEVNLRGACKYFYPKVFNATVKDTKSLYKNIKSEFKELAKTTLNFESGYIFEEFARKCAQGGIIWSNPVYLNRVVKGVGSVDITSSYPYQIGARSYPINLDITRLADSRRLQSIIIELKELSNKMARGSSQANVKYTNSYGVGFLAKIRFTNLRCKEYTDINGNLNRVAILSASTRKCEELQNPIIVGQKLYSCDSVVYNLTDIGLVRLMALYDYDSLEVLDGVYYDMGDIAKYTYLATGYAIDRKQRVKKELKEVKKIYGEHSPEYKAKTSEYSTSKVRLNSMYGATYMNPCHETLVYDESGNRTLEPEEYSIDDCSVAYMQGLYVAEWGQFQETLAICFCIKYKLPILYVHTDSIKAQGLTQELADELNSLVAEPTSPTDYRVLADSSLGSFEYEWFACEFIAYGNMRCSYVVDGSFHISYSGLSFDKILAKYPESEHYTNEDFIKRFLVTGKIYSDESIYDNEEDLDIESSEKLSTDLSQVNIWIPELKTYTIQSLVPLTLIIESSEDYSLSHKEESEHFQRLMGHKYMTCYDYLERGDLYVD